jgi:uncharacterized membrane protein YfcA
MTAVDETLALTLLIFTAAVLYSSVGHAGASGYLAVMALFGLAPEVMRPTALVLNVLVATIATTRFAMAGYFSWRGLWPFIVLSIPCAFIGGAIQLPGSIYKPLVGVILLLAAARLLWSTLGERVLQAKASRSLPLAPAIASGGGIGLLSGLTGTGGGIFLSPLLLFSGWAETRGSGGISAAFILVNSLAGLAGNLTSVRSLPEHLPLLVAAAGIGGLLGAELGSRRLANAAFQRLLAAVLVIAGLKLLFT